MKSYYQVPIAPPSGINSCNSEGYKLYERSFGSNRLLVKPNTDIVYCTEIIF